MAALSKDQQKQVIRAAVAIAKRSMRDAGADPKNKDAFKAYWGKHRKHFVVMSKIARKVYVGV